MKKIFITAMAFALVFPFLSLNNQLLVKASETAESEDSNEQNFTLEELESLAERTNAYIEIKEKTRVLENGYSYEVRTEKTKLFIGEIGEIRLVKTYYEGKMIVGYYYVDRNYFYQEVYKDGVLIKVINYDHNNSNNASLFNSIPLIESVETDAGWGYAFEKYSDKRSFACPQVLVDSGIYNRRNIEIYENELPSTQSEFSTRVFRISRAESDIDRLASNTLYASILETLGTVLNASLGSVSDALETLGNLINAAETGSEIYKATEIIAENSAELFNLYDNLSRYDHLN